MGCGLFGGCIDYEFLGRLVDALEIRVEPFADKWLLVIIVGYTYYDDIESTIRAVQRFLRENGVRSRPREIAPDFYGDLPVLRLVFEINNGGGRKK
ncbi:MAG: hypothetical protein GXO43_04035 [Crenarchaeota archaeon]|nr:hypothetical protein [Thermoproteota archaeon]